MKKQLTKGVSLALLALAVWNCKTSDPEPTPYESGVFILNSGNFSQNNGTLSFLPRTSQTVLTDVFHTANPNLGLTGGVQGYTEVNGKGLILVDNSTAGQDKVEIVEAGTLKSRATLKTPDIENPRQVIQVGPNKAYVSCWDVSGDYAKGTFYKDPGYIAVVDLNTNTVTKKIPAVKGVETMVVAGTEVFVGSNAYSGDKTLLVIDLTNDTEKQRIDFGSTPEPLGLDAGGKLWVRAGKDLVQVDPQTRLPAKRLTFTTAPAAVTFSADRQRFYYTLSGKTYALETSVSAGAASGRQVINRTFSALGVDPASSNLYASVIPSYAQAGYVLRYQVTSTSASLIDSVRAEIGPSGFYFR